MHTTLIFASIVAGVVAAPCDSVASCAAVLSSVASNLPPSLSRLVSAVGASILSIDSRTSGASTKDSTYCKNASAFDLLPLTVANVSSGGTTTVWGGDGCFSSVTATAEWYSGGGVNISLTGEGPSGLFCGDLYILATSYSISQPVEISALTPRAVLSYPAWSVNSDEALDIALHGISIGLLPCGVVNSAVSLLATINIFSPLSGKISDLVNSNLIFLESRGIWNGPGGPGTPLEAYGKLTPIAPASIRSGDYFAILRFDGLDPLIGFGTGFGGTGHSAIAMWRGVGAARALFVVEATDMDPFGPAVFFGSGIIVTPYAKWVDLALNATYNVAILPLSPALSASFDEDASWKWFDGVVGASYGYSNFLFAVLDTADPFISLPLPIDERMLIPLLNVADALLGPAPSNATWTSLTVDTMLVHGLNQRFGTTCANLACIISRANNNKLANKIPSTVLEAMAMPELDSWRYGGNVSFVCSAFAAALYQNALGTVLPPFAATEQTPADNVKMAFYDPTYWTAAACPGGLWTPTEGHGVVCQLMGPVRMPLNGYNTLPLYANMNNKCGSQWPSYERCPGGGTACAC